jgi:hypothetical protein
MCHAVLRRINIDENQRERLFEFWYKGPAIHGFTEGAALVHDKLLNNITTRGRQLVGSKLCSCVTAHESAEHIHLEAV